MKRCLWLVLCFCAGLSSDVTASTEHGMGTRRVNLSGMFDPNTEGGSRFVLGFGYGQFVTDAFEAGVAFNLQTDDRIETLGTGLYLERNLYSGTALSPFVGTTLQYISSNLNRGGGLEISADGIGFGLYGGANIFVHPDIALRGQIGFYAATDAVYPEEDDLGDTDLRLDLGLSFYF